MIIKVSGRSEPIRVEPACGCQISVDPNILSLKRVHQRNKMLLNIQLPPERHTLYCLEFHWYATIIQLLQFGINCV